MNWLSFTCNRLPLLNLPNDVLDALRCGKIAYTKARAIARIKDDIQRQKLLNQAIEDNLSLNQIRAYIKAIQSKPELQSPQVTVTTLYRRLVKAKLWEDPQRWSQAEALLLELEALLNQESPSGSL
jgi:ParB family transcriptional regulator, chromosome partitioning protein